MRSTWKKRFEAAEKAQAEELPDDLNPDFIFAMTSHSLLRDIVSGKIDPVQLAQNEMANRGLGKGGEWIGFEAAAKLWKSAK